MATPSKGTGVKPTESNGRTKVPGTHSTTASEESMEMEATLMTDKTNAAAPPDADHVKVGQATQMMPRDIGARPKVRMTRRPKKEARATQAGLSLGDRKLIKQCLGCKWEGKSLRGHLRAKISCQSFYDMGALERDAMRVKKQQQAAWELSNRVKRTKRMKKKPSSGLKLHSECPEKQLERKPQEVKKIQKAKWEVDNRKGKIDTTKKGKDKVYFPIKGSYDCTICDKTFTFKKNLSRHITDVHEECKVFACYKCPKKFSRKQSLSRHLAAHEMKTTSPKVASFKTAKQNEGANNTKKHKIKCKGCQFKGKSLLGHLKAKKDCQKFYDMDLLERCAKELKKKKQAEWESANREKRTKRMRNKKETCGDKSSTHTCNICDKVFTLENKLKRHINDVHNELKRYLCPDCPQYFSRKENLQKHIKRGKHFAWKGQKDKAKDSMNLDTRFTGVDLSEKKSSLPPRIKDNGGNANLSPASSSRKENSSSEIIKDKTDSYPYACSHCEAKFKEKFNLKSHVDDVHKKVKRFKCDKCSEEFSRLYNLTRHKRENTHLLHLDCQSCGQRKFFRSSALRERHLIHSKCDHHGNVYNTTCHDAVDNRIKEANLQDRCLMPANFPKKDAAIKEFYEKNKKDEEQKSASKRLYCEHPQKEEIVRAAYEKYGKHVVERWEIECNCETHKSITCCPHHKLSHYTHKGYLDCHPFGTTCEPGCDDCPICITPEEREKKDLGIEYENNFGYKRIGKYDFKNHHWGAEQHLKERKYDERPEFFKSREWHGIRWDSMKGYYECIFCKQKLDGTPEGEHEYGNSDCASCIKQKLEGEKRGEHLVHDKNGYLTCVNMKKKIGEPYSPCEHFFCQKCSGEIKLKPWKKEWMGCKCKDWMSKTFPEST